MALDKQIDAGESKVRFSESFVERLPIGTVVENTFLATELGQNFFGTTAEGLIYEDPNSNDVNIVNVNGHPGDFAVWSAVNLVHKS